MDTKEFIKRAKRAAARNALFFSSWFLNLMPFSFVKAVSRFFVAVGFSLTIRQKQIARESLDIAFGKEKSEEEINGIIKKCFSNFGRGMIELIYYMDHPSMIKENVTIEGQENLDAAFKQGKGVVAISAHFGSFPLMLLRLAQEGYKTNAIIRPARDKKIEKHFLSLRDRLGLKTVYAIPRRKCVDASIKALRNNELLFIPLDQNFGSGKGVFVDFFGQKAATATGPTTFARRTGALMVPMFIIRDKQDKHKIVIEKPLDIEQGGDEKETVFINTQKITKLIESYVRKYPTEWGWMHRRWKSKAPTSEAGVVENSK